MITFERTVFCCLERNLSNHLLRSSARESRKKGYWARTKHIGLPNISDVDLHYMVDQYDDYLSSIWDLREHNIETMLKHQVRNFLSRILLRSFSPVMDSNVCVCLRERNRPSCNLRRRFSKNFSKASSVITCGTQPESEPLLLTE